MNRQKTLANVSTFERYKKPTKREKFLDEMERGVSWKELYALIQPFSPKPDKGRPPGRSGTDAPNPFPAELLSLSEDRSGRSL